MIEGDFYLSHGARFGPNREPGPWFIVEPRDDYERLHREIRSLLKANRRVYHARLKGANGYEFSEVRP